MARSQSITNLDDLPLLLTSSEMAALLRRSVRTIGRWDRLGKIPASRNGTWHRDEVREWLDAGRPERSDAPGNGGRSHA